MKGAGFSAAETELGAAARTEAAASIRGEQNFMSRKNKASFVRSRSDVKCRQFLSLERTVGQKSLLPRNYDVPFPNGNAALFMRQGALAEICPAPDKLRPGDFSCALRLHG